MVVRLSLVAHLLLFCFCLVSSYTMPKRRIWHQDIVTWSFRDPFHLLANEKSRRLMRSLIATAFALWEEALDGRLEFHEITEANVKSDEVKKPPDVDIDILFARGAHGDNEAFDNMGGMVAHSEYPPKGILHLDADEKWSFDGSDGVDLRYTTLFWYASSIGRCAVNPKAIRAEAEPPKSELISIFSKSDEQGSRDPMELFRCQLQRIVGK